MSKSVLVRNEQKTVKTVEAIQTFVFNLTPAKARVDTLEGRNYTVVPMVMLTEGVHKGSNGPLYYPQDELGKTPMTWNHKPIVVYHPELNGQGISACQPDIINNRKVGLIMNAKYSKGKLRAEAWIEKERADIVDNRIMSAIEAGEMMELSTGVFTDLEDNAGEWKGEKYVGIARNYRPDHLALLPDQIGACSIKDGAGFIRNQATIEESIQMMFNDGMKKKGITENAVLVDDRSDFLIYSQGGKYFRLGYSQNEMALSDAMPVEVKIVAEYRTVAADKSISQNRKDKDVIMDKKKIVDALIGNSGWVETDRETLMALDEKILTRMSEVKKVEPPVIPVVNKEKEIPIPKVEVPVLNKPFDYEEWLKSAPASVQEFVSNGVQIGNEEKARLIGVITANKNNIFSKEQLNGKPLGELHAIARMAAPVESPQQRQQFYYGQAPVTENTSKEQEPMEIPVMNFAKK